MEKKKKRLLTSTQKYNSKWMMMVNLLCQLGWAMVSSFWSNTSLDIAVKVFVFGHVPLSTWDLSPPAPQPGI